MEDLDAASIEGANGRHGSQRPGEDGPKLGTRNRWVPAYVYQRHGELFIPKILEEIKRSENEGEWNEQWVTGIMRSVPKEAGNKAVGKQRPILLCTKTKWITGAIKAMVDDALMAVTPVEQQGFVTGRSMDRHLLEVWGAEYQRHSRDSRL